MNRQFVKHCYVTVFSKYNMQYLLDTGTSAGCADRTLGDLRDFCLLREGPGWPPRHLYNPSCNSGHCPRLLAAEIPKYIHRNTKIQ